MPVEQALLLPERIAPGQFAGDETYGDVCADSEPSGDDLPGLRLVIVPDVGPPFDGEPLSVVTASLAGGHFGQAADTTAAERTRVGPVTADGPCTRPQAASNEAAHTGRLEPSREVARTGRLTTCEVSHTECQEAAGEVTCSRLGTSREAVQAGQAGRVETGGEWPVQFARLLVEALAGARPVRQIMPWTSVRARGQLRRLLPLFGAGQRPRVLRVITTRPTRAVIEMAVIVRVGARTRALAIRLERTAAPRQLLRPVGPAIGGPGRYDAAAVGAAGRHDPAAIGATGRHDAQAIATATALRWVCTDIETG